MDWLSKFFTKNEQQPSDNVMLQKPEISASDCCEQGKKSLDACKYVEAMEYFQAAVEADKRFEKAYLLLATAYEKQGKMDKAKAALYELLANDPNNKRAQDRIVMLEELNVAKPKSESTGTITFQTASPNSNNGVNSKTKSRKESSAELWEVFSIVLIIVVIVIVDIILIANDIFELHRGGTLLFLIDLIVFVLLGKLFGLGD